MSSTVVTGSMYLVSCPTGEEILLDCGLYQSPNPYESWKVNKLKFDFKPSNLTFVAISHLNADHLCLIPKLYKEGAKCPTYIAEENLDFLKPMLEDSAKIMERDVVAFNRRYKKEHQPIYIQDDVNNVLPFFRGCQINEIINITENVAIRFIPAGHIYGSTQIELFIKLKSGLIKKISYSGDLGNILFEQPFVTPFEPIIKTQVFIGETTYNNPLRSVKKNQRDKDINMIKTVIEDYCIDRKGIVLIPVFALQRIETMLYTLWNIYKDTDFNIPIIIDSPLAVKLLDCFASNLTGENKSNFNKMLAWKNVKVIRTVEESISAVEDTSPKIVLSSSGMMSQGRSVLYLKKILPRTNCCILTCGYMAEGTLGYKIKNNSTQKTITIDNKAYPNRCGIYSLSSFSSHMQYEELLNYYTNLANNGCEKIVLVHGNDGKLDFKKCLEDNVGRINMTTKIIAANKNTVVRI